MDRSRVVIAEIHRARGIRGEVVASSLTDVPGRLEQLRTANVRLLSGEDRAVTLEEAWPHKDGWVLKFTGVDSLNAADEFRGADLWVAEADRGVLPQGEYFQSDLTGCELFDRLSGRVIGAVEGWQQYGGAPLMELKVDGREVLIPFISAECDIDLNNRLIRMDLPEGILDL